MPVEECWATVPTILALEESRGEGSCPKDTSAECLGLDHRHAPGTHTDIMTASAASVECATQKAMSGEMASRLHLQGKAGFIHSFIQSFI